jgi:hypothetical protein
MGLQLRYQLQRVGSVPFLEWFLILIDDLGALEDDYMLPTVRKLLPATFKIGPLETCVFTEMNPFFAARKTDLRCKSCFTVLFRRESMKRFEASGTSSGGR